MSQFRTIDLVSIASGCGALIEYIEAPHGNAQHKFKIWALKHYIHKNEKEGHRRDQEPRPSPSKHFFQISDIDLLVGWMLQLKCSKNTTVGYVPKHGNGEQGGPGQDRCRCPGGPSLRGGNQKTRGYNCWRSFIWLHSHSDSSATDETIWEFPHVNVS